MTETPPRFLSFDSRRAAQILLLFVLLLYARVIVCGWVNWDDTIYFLNPYLQEGFSWASLHWALTDTDAVHMWIPLTWVSILLDQTIFGGNPAGSHLVNLLLHAANTLLLLHLLRRLTQRDWPSFFVAALFAVHPQHVEVVAWATERKELLAALFGLFALHQYVTFTQARDQGLSLGDMRVIQPLAGSLLGYFLSLTAKPMWITLPFVLLLLDGWPLRRWQKFRWSLLGEKLFYVPILLGIVLLTRHIYKTPSFAADGVSFWDLLPYTLLNYINYLTKTFFPVGLAPLYPLPLTKPDFPEMAGAALLLLAGTGLAWRWVRRHPWLLVGWLWFLGTLLPVSGIVHLGRHAITDRFTYLPHMGLFMALAWEVDHLVNRWRINPHHVARGALVVLGICAVLAWQQIGIWRDSMTLWSHTVATTRNNHYAHHMLASLYMEERHLEQAEREIQQAVDLQPGQIDYAILQADIAYRRGNKATALQQLQTLATKYPDTPKILLKMAMIHMQEEAFSQALPLLRQAMGPGGKETPSIRHADAALEAEFNLGLILALQGQGTAAQPHLDHVFRVQPWLRHQRCTLLEALAKHTVKLPACAALHP
ncbi:MAG: hypothetical protein H7833_13630 [Magnetococcus sp. DMHC-1]